MTSRSRPLLTAGAAVVSLTALGGLLGTLAPRLAGHTEPHPALTGTLATAAGILATNLRVLVLPFALWLLRFPAERLSRHLGDLLVLVVVTLNTLTVGIELGRWRTQLIPYVPQLPLEWAALTIAVGAWLTARNDRAERSHLISLAVLSTLLLVSAAAVETWATPHSHVVRGLVAGPRDAAGEPHGLVGDGGCLRPGVCADLGPVASRSPAPFPSPRSVPLGRLAGTYRSHVNHRPPQGGITWTSTRSS